MKRTGALCVCAWVCVLVNALTMVDKSWKKLAEKVMQTRIVVSGQPNCSQPPSNGKMGIVFSAVGRDCHIGQASKPIEPKSRLINYCFWMANNWYFIFRLNARCPFQSDNTLISVRSCVWFFPLIRFFPCAFSDDSFSPHSFLAARWTSNALALQWQKAKIRTLWFIGCDIANIIDKSCTHWCGR